MRTRARLCVVRERETCRVSISHKHWTNIDVSSLPFLSRDEKRVVLFIYQLLSSISEWKRGRARNCVNPCPFFSLPFPSFLFFFYFLSVSRMCSRCSRKVTASSKRTRHSLKIKFRELSEFVLSELY